MAGRMMRIASALLKFLWEWQAAFATQEVQPHRLHLATSAPLWPHVQQVRLQ
jgi:hypothetical protein